MQKRLSHKTISLLATLLLVLTMIPATAFADTTADSSGNPDEATPQSGGGLHLYLGEEEVTGTTLTIDYAAWATPLIVKDDAGTVIPNGKVKWTQTEIRATELAYLEKGELYPDISNVGTTATLTATYEGKTASVNTTVEVKTFGVNLMGSNGGSDEARFMIIDFKGNNDRALSWLAENLTVTSSNEEVVDASCISLDVQRSSEQLYVCIKPKTPGTTTLTFSLTGGASVTRDWTAPNGFYMNYSLRGGLQPGESRAIEALWNYKSLGSAAKWTSSDETIATVDETGKVTALKVGTV